MKNCYAVTNDESIVERIDSCIKQAVQAQASDIHFEPAAIGMRIRFRIDGVLYDQGVIPKEFIPQIIGRLKVLAHMDSTEKRVPQDGKFSRELEKHMIDFRVSTFPCSYGEKVVVRILDRAIHTINLDDLGFSADVLQRCKALFYKQQGLFLVTGPTGSGKTTTLYAGLSLLHSSEKNIVTLEDPVEYTIDGITQGHINPQVGFTFENGIRAVLRQDPDILMVGEIRDKQTAHTAIEASLTGHLILSTLHTNDAPSSIIRLIDMGVESYLLNASLIGVLAQRLVRILCNECKQQEKCTIDEKRWLNLEYVYRAYGCSLCAHRGYKGRLGIFELLIITPEIKALITDQPNKDAITDCALQQGMQTLMQDGIAKVNEGIISPEELLRVIV